MMLLILFFFNDTATTEIYTLSLHDALPIFLAQREHRGQVHREGVVPLVVGDLLQRVVAHLEGGVVDQDVDRSEEHTSELQSRQYLVCRLLLDKKKNQSFFPYLSPSALDLLD